MTRKHIVVVDGAWVGHHPVYLKVFARVLLEAGYKVSVFCPTPEEMTTWFTHTFTGDSFQFDAYYYSDRELPFSEFLPGRIKLPLTCLSRWLQAARALKEIGKPDMVFFAWLDSYLSGYVPAWLLDWRFPFAWSGLYFHPRHYRSQHRFPLVAKYLPQPERLVARSGFACSLAILDEGIVNKLRIRLYKKPVFVFPDFADETPPCENYSLVDEIKKKAAGRRIIGLLGSLECRKGMLTLMRTARHPMARDWYFVFAGKLVEQTFSECEMDEIKSFLSAPRENCFLHFDVIPNDAQFNAIVNSCDVIFAAYQGFLHSSNLVTKAANFGKSLIVSEGGYMEEVVKRYNLGEVVPEGDVQAVISSLDRLTTCDFALRRAGMREFSIAQSQVGLRQSLLDVVANCAGSAVDGTGETY